MNKYHVFLVLNVLWVLFGVWMTYFNIFRDAGFVSISAGVVMIWFGIHWSFLNYGKLKTSRKSPEIVFVEVKSLKERWFIPDFIYKRMILKKLRVRRKNKGLKEVSG